MKIFHVITTLNKGGAESHLAALCRGQLGQGAQVTLAYLKGDGYWAESLREAGVRTIALDARNYADIAAVARLARAIAAERPDIVHAHMPPAELYATLALLQARGPRLVISKHVDRHPFAPLPGKNLLERYCAGRADAVICISQAVSDYFAARWPKTLAQKLLTVRYGLDPAPATRQLDEHARGLRSEWGVGEKTVLYGIAARLVEQKAIDTLLRAFALFRGRSQQDVRLAIVGQGPLEAELRALAGELGLGQAVIWAGFRTDIPVVMRAFDVFTLSSIYEGFGLVLLEAMEASTPIIASGVSAIPEIVVDGRTGLLVEPRDPAAMADAMARMADGNERGRMGSAGHDRLLEEFGEERMVSRTFEVYRNVLAGGTTLLDAA